MDLSRFFFPFVWIILDPLWRLSILHVLSAARHVPHVLVKGLSVRMKVVLVVVWVWVVVRKDSAVGSFGDATIYAG